MENGRKKLLFLLIDAFGISPTWKGNAILSANPQNIFNFWRESKHFLIESDFYNDEYYNQQLLHSVISTGRSHLSDKKYIDQIIKDQTAFSSSGLYEIYDQITRRSSALHFIGFLPKERGGKYSSADQILSFVKHARSQGVHNIYLHLFLDETLANHEVLGALNSLERALNEINAGEIVTIAGIESLRDHNLKGLLKSLVIGNGKKALSAGQAIAKYLTGEPAAMDPTVIVSKNRPIGRLSNFDNIFYFDFTSSELEYLITNYLSLDYIKDVFSSVKLPRFLSFLTLFRHPELEDKVRYIATRDFGETIVDAISSAGFSQVEIADASRVNHFLTNFNNSKVPKGLERLFLPEGDESKTMIGIAAATKSLLARKEFDVVYSEISMLDRFSQTGHFRDAVGMVTKLDSILLDLKESALENNYDLIIASNHGGAEKMADLSDIERLNQKSLNPVPFILANKKNVSRKFTGGNIHDQFMYDIMEKREKLIDIAPTVLSFLDLPKGKAMEGRDLLGG